MGDGFGRFRSSGVIYRATCGTTTTAGYTQHWIIAPPLTMSDGPRKTWASTKPREDPGQKLAAAQPASLDGFEKDGIGVCRFDGQGDLGDAGSR
jgi:hypothetical protein